MDGIAAIVEAADSGWALAAIFLIGLYALAWKYGGEMLKLSRENNAVTKQVAEDIITNHGSKNIGDAIDRLTEWVSEHMEESRAADAELAIVSAEVAKLSTSFASHLESHREEGPDEFTD